MLTTSARLPLAKVSSHTQAWPRLRHIRVTPRWMHKARSLCLPSCIEYLFTKLLECED